MTRDQTIPAPASESLIATLCRPEDRRGRAPAKTGATIKPKNTTFGWGSHRPVLQALMEVCTIRTAVELGMGESSTPFLLSRVPSLISLENNQAWFDQLTARIPARAGYFPRCRRLFTDDSASAEVFYGTPPSQISASTLRQAASHYREILDQSEEFDLVLIDQYASTRTLSMFMFAPCADIMLIHDAEPLGLDPSNPEYDVYRYRDFYESQDASAFVHLRVDTMSPWSDVLIRKSLCVDVVDLSRRINTHFGAYFQQFATEAPASPRYRDSYELDPADPPRL